MVFLNGSFIGLPSTTLPHGWEKAKPQTTWTPCGRNQSVPVQEKNNVSAFRGSARKAETSFPEQA
jgi:hypothetical protein